MSENRITKSRAADKLSLDAVYIGAESVHAAKSIAYGCRWLIMATMPYRKTDADVVERVNGNVSVRYLAGKPGLPYGPKPRLIGTWLETEIVRTRERTIKLGDTLTDFIRSLGFDRYQGGKVYTSIREQCRRLFASSVHIDRMSQGSWSHRKLDLVVEHDLWWSTKSPDQVGMFGSTVTVGERYYHEVITRPVPLDMRALSALKSSAMALDIYRWYASRLCLVPTNGPSFVRWSSIQKQLGVDYKDDKEGRKTFRRRYLQQHAKVMLVYPQAQVEFERGGVVLRHSPPPVSPKRRSLPRPRR